MKYFHSNGGNNKPHFTHRIKMPRVLPEGVYEWCEEYDDADRPFRRFHIEWDQYGDKGYVIVQFEWEEAAIMFALKWV